MKEIDLKQFDAAIGKNSAKFFSEFDASSCDQPDQMELPHFVPLPPTETGRKRHAAHQLKAPKFTHDLADSKQSQYTEMYLG